VLFRYRRKSLTRPVPVAGNGMVFMKRPFIVGITLALLGAMAAAEDLRAPPDVAAAPADATRAPSGLAWKVLTPGHGHDHPGLNDRVKIAFTGWTADGKMFDAMPESKPAQFADQRLSA